MICTTLTRHNHTQSETLKVARGAFKKLDRSKRVTHPALNSSHELLRPKNIQKSILSPPFYLE